MDQYIGRLLDNRYEILEIIGTGGMAVVYKARCHRLNRLVAIKILKDEFARDEEFRRRFRAEGEAVAMLGNPNIVQVYDVSSTEIANYIVMELIEGITLKQYLEKRGSLNWKETLHFAMQIAKALEHAHSRGIVHRDIKPHNVMVLKNGSVKVTDFGIARVMSKSNTLTKEALGSVHYISPEQAKGGWVDNRSDLYSLSVVMYEMMTGRPPYDGESPVAVAIQHINGGAALPSTLNPNIPAGLEQIIMKGMALDTKDRYSNAGEMLRDMEEFRKDPAILFVFGTPRVSDATQAVDLSGIARANAERKSDESGNLRRAGAAAAGAAGARPRTGTGSAKGHAAGASGKNAGAAAQQRRNKAREEEEKRSRITTVAIVSCCAVAVIAIIILLIA
ncbi:MAG: protein kinase, partial [Oscillospiraceae bacterium]|nr:protein kinase [Oscillospiraceae bacterium]